MKEKKGVLCTTYFLQKKFYEDLCFISVYIVLKKLSGYTYFYKLKNIPLCTFLLLKSSKRLSVFLLTAVIRKYFDVVCSYMLVCSLDALSNTSQGLKITFELYDYHYYSNVKGNYFYST